MGLTAVTFLVVFPFTHVIVVALAEGVAAAGAGAGAAGVVGAVGVMASFGFNLMESFAWLNVNPEAVNRK